MLNKSISLIVLILLLGCSNDDPAERYKGVHLESEVVAAAELHLDRAVFRHDEYLVNFYFYDNIYLVFFKAPQLGPMVNTRSNIPGYLVELDEKLALIRRDVFIPYLLTETYGGVHPDSEVTAAAAVHLDRADNNFDEYFVNVYFYDNKYLVSFLAPQNDRGENSHSQLPSYRVELDRKLAFIRKSVFFP